MENIKQIKFRVPEYRYFDLMSVILYRLKIDQDQVFPDHQVGQTLLNFYYESTLVVRRNSSVPEGKTKPLNYKSSPYFYIRHFSISFSLVRK